LLCAVELTFSLIKRCILADFGVAPIRKIAYRAWTRMLFLEPLAKSNFAQYFLRVLVFAQTKKSRLIFPGLVDLRV
jgi:hypothetical protein